MSRPQLGALPRLRSSTWARGQNGLEYLSYVDRASGA